MSGTVSDKMYYLLTQILFWVYWLIVLIAGGLIVRELFRTQNRLLQLTATLTLIPLVLRIFLIK